MWKEVVQKNGAQGLFKILAALPIIDMESLKFQLYFSYILVIGTIKNIFKYIGNNSFLVFQWIFWLSLSILTSWFYTSHHPRGTENSGLAHFPYGHTGKPHTNWSSSALLGDTTRCARMWLGWQGFIVTHYNRRHNQLVQWKKYRFIKDKENKLFRGKWSITACY